eukprot:1141652-Pelagomonas_calceolata.AAC.3
MHCVNLPPQYAGSCNSIPRHCKRNLSPLDGNIPQVSAYKAGRLRECILLLTWDTPVNPTTLL